MWICLLLRVQLHIGMIIDGKVLLLAFVGDLLRVRERTVASTETWD